MRPIIKRQRRTHYTVLIVGEGHADYKLLRTIQSVYLGRDCGLRPTFINGRGFGGAHTLDRAIQAKRDTPFDACAVLVDTDRHWGDVERTLARLEGIHTFESSPCLEAMLLQIVGQKAAATSSANKRAFRQQFGGDAHQDGILERHFTRGVLDAGRVNVRTLRDLLLFLRV